MKMSLANISTVLFVCVTLPTALVSLPFVVLACIFGFAFPPLFILVLLGGFSLWVLFRLHFQYFWRNQSPSAADKNALLLGLFVGCLFSIYLASMFSWEKDLLYKLAMFWPFVGAFGYGYLLLGNSIAEFTGNDE